MDSSFLDQVNHLRDIVSTKELRRNVLLIEETDNSPFVYLNSVDGKIVFKGECRPPDIGEFTRPILNFIENNFNETKSIEGHFIIVYTNSSFAKRLLDLFKILSDHYRNGVNVECYWYYEKYDYDTLSMGEEISRLVKMPFNLMEVEDYDVLVNLKFEL